MSIKIEIYLSMTITYKEQTICFYLRIVDSNQYVQLLFEESIFIEQVSDELFL